MDFGKVNYISIDEGGQDRLPQTTLKLTLIGQSDEDVMHKQGIATLRLRRIIRLTKEADEQGCLLSYEDLEALLATSLSTLKRDISYLESKGILIPLKNRKKRLTPLPSGGAGVERQ